MKVCRQRKYPLRLAFRTREGVEVVDGRETPPFRVWSEGGGRGGVSTEEIPSSHVSRDGGKETPPSHIWSEGGVLMVCRQRKRPLHLAFGAREGAEMGVVVC